MIDGDKLTEMQIFMTFLYLNIAHLRIKILEPGS